jgi:pyruvate formate lyase activating enzyme
MRTGLVFDIKKYSIHDGPGIRTTVFFKGCPLTCWWCHNPESRGVEAFVHYSADRCIGTGDCVQACPEGALSLTADGVLVDAGLCCGHGACVAACPTEALQWVGERYTVSRILKEVEKDRLFYEQSGGGVTFSGGEPLLQWEFLVDVLDACGARGLHRAVDTTGSTSPEVLAEVARRTDLFLYDLKTLDPDLHREATGVLLPPILDNLRQLLDSGSKVRIRIPLVPGVNDGENIDDLGEFLTGLPHVEGVDLLPFHISARDKHRKFGIPWLLDGIEPLTPEEVLAISSRLEGHGLTVKVGG